MAAAAEQQVAAEQAFFTTSYTFGSGTTSTAALMIWRAISNKLIKEQLPMTGEELSKETGLPVDYIASYFSQTYYQRHYGFRRFNSEEEWQAWAREGGVLYVPGKHDPVPEADDYEDDDYDDEDFEEEDEE